MSRQFTVVIARSDKDHAGENCAQASDWKNDYNAIDS